MKLLLDRKYKKEKYTIGKLYINNTYFCDTIEDRDRHLTQTTPLNKIKEIKVAAQTAIPTGTYNIRMDIISPKYSLKPWYVKNCNKAKLPRLENVPGFSGVLIHVGNTEKDSAGCILTGVNDTPGMVTKSKETFLKLYNKLYQAYQKGEKITITIK